MFTSKGLSFVLGAINLLAGMGPQTLASHSQANESNQQIADLNVASLKSIESTWIKVPPICKARAFHANPVQIEHKAISAKVQNIYSSFDV
jgi:hypothetical protein